MVVRARTHAAGAHTAAHTRCLQTGKGGGGGDCLGGEAHVEAGGEGRGERRVALCRGSAITHTSHRRRRARSSRVPRRRKHRRLRGRRRRRRQAAAFRARVTWVMGRVDRSEAGAWRWTWRMRQWSPEKAALSSMAQWRHERSPMSAPVEYSMLAQCHCSTCSADTSYAPSQPSGTRTKYLCL